MKNMKLILAALLIIGSAKIKSETYQIQLKDGIYQANPKFNYSIENNGEIYKFDIIFKNSQNNNQIKLICECYVENEPIFYTLRWEKFSAESFKFYKFEACDLYLKKGDEIHYGNKTTAPFIEAMLKLIQKKETIVKS